MEVRDNAEGDEATTARDFAAQLGWSSCDQVGGVVSRRWELRRL